MKNKIQGNKRIIFIDGILDKITANGKSIGEVREFEGLKVQEFRNVADAFSLLLTYKKLQN
ncbi:hypothetical protein [Soonwooa purpurea]